MSVVDEIKRIKNNIKNAYTKAGEKGATLPDIQNSNNLPDTINTIKTDINLQDKTVKPKTSQQEVTADSEYDGLGKVTVDAIPTIEDKITKNGTFVYLTQFATKVTVDVPTPHLESIDITENGTHDVSNYINANVNVTPNLQDKIAEPTTSQQEVTADSEYDGLGKVTVKAVEPSKYYKPETSTDIIPTTSEQVITPDSGKVFKKVTVKPIPEQYVDTTEGTANESTLREGFIAFSKGKKLIGTYKIGGKTITQNGVYLPVSDNLDAFDSVTVDVPSSILKDVVGSWKYTSTDGEMVLVLNEDYTATLSISDTSMSGTYTFDGAKVVFTYSNGSFTYNISVINGTRILVQTLGNLQFTKTETGSGDTSGEIVTEDITITPTTDTQIKTRSTGKYINQVTVEGVTSSIDSNIKAENIKKDVTILGVTGILEEGTKPGGIYTSNCINNSCVWTDFVGTWEMQVNDIDKYIITIGKTEGDVTFGYTQDGTLKNTITQNISINNGIINFDASDADGEGNTENFSLGISNMNSRIMVWINIWNQGYLYPFIKVDDGYQMDDDMRWACNVCEYDTQEGFTYKVLQMIPDYNAYTDIVVPYGGAVKTSDGGYYTTDTRHAWDDTNARQSMVKSYKTRWLIYYYTTATVNTALLKNVVYACFNGVQIGNGIFQNRTSLMYFSIINGANISSSSTVNMFSDCSSLQSVPQLDTSNVTDMRNMFSGCSSLQSIPQLDTSKVTNMTFMFEGCSALESIPQLDTSKVTDMMSIFEGCRLLQTIPQLNTSNVTSMRNMFYKCHSLQSIPQLDTSKVTNMTFMFDDCYSLQSIPQLDTSKVTETVNMFSDCSSLQSVPQLDTSNVTDMRNMFASCSSLLSISQLDVSKATETANMFIGCSVLEDVNITNINTAIDLSSSTKYSHDVLLSLINNLADRTETTSLRFCIGETNLAKLSDEEKAIATNKNWTLS